MRKECEVIPPPPSSPLLFPSGRSLIVGRRGNMCEPLRRRRPGTHSPSLPTAPRRSLPVASLPPPEGSLNVGREGGKRNDHRERRRERINVYHCEGSLTEGMPCEGLPSPITFQPLQQRHCLPPSPFPSPQTNTGAVRKENTATTEESEPHLLLPFSRRASQNKESMGNRDRGTASSREAGNAHVDH